MPPNSHRSPARLIAPAALLVLVLAIALIVLGSSGGSDSKEEEGKTKEASGQPATTTGRTQTSKRSQKGTTYTVQPGDTLGRIAEKTQIEVETLQDLNPSLDPQALISGQKIKLPK